MGQHRRKVGASKEYMCRKCGVLRRCDRLDKVPEYLVVLQLPLALPSALLVGSLESSGESMLYPRRTANKNPDEIPCTVVGQYPKLETYTDVALCISVTDHYSKFKYWIG